MYGLQGFFSKIVLMVRIFSKIVRIFFICTDLFKKIYGLYRFFFSKIVRIVRISSEKSFGHPVKEIIFDTDVLLETPYDDDDTPDIWDDFEASKETRKCCNRIRKQGRISGGGIFIIYTLKTLTQNKFCF